MRSTIWAACFAVIALASNTAWGAFVFGIQSAPSYQSDGVNPTTGTFNLVVTGITAPNTSPQSTTALNPVIQYDGGNGAGFTFTSAVNGNIPGGSPFLFNITNGGTRISTTVGNVFAPAPFNVSVGDIVASISFSVAAPDSGSFNIIGGPGGGAFINPLAPAAVSYTSGLINIAAVPEPSSIMLMGLTAVGAGVVYRVRKTRKVAKV